MRIGRVVFSVDGKPLASDATAPYGASLASANLSLGRHRVEARAYDGAGQQAASNAPVVVLDSSAGVANGTPTVRNARIVGGLGKRAKSRLTVRYGKGARLPGRLVTTDGTPIPGAALEVASRVLAGNRGFRTIAGARTSPAPAAASPTASRRAHRARSASPTAPTRATRRSRPSACSACAPGPACG